MVSIRTNLKAVQEFKNWLKINRKDFHYTDELFDDFLENYDLLFFGSDDYPYNFENIYIYFSAFHCGWNSRHYKLSNFSDVMEKFNDTPFD